MATKNVRAGNIFDLREELDCARRYALNSSTLNRSIFFWFNSWQCACSFDEMGVALQTCEVPMQKRKTRTPQKGGNGKKIRNLTFKESEETDMTPQVSSIKIGNISNNSGKLNIAGGNIITTENVTGLRAEEIRELFDPLYRSIETHKKALPEEKETLESDVRAIQSAVTEASQKGEKIKEGFLLERFRNIARLVPDVLDVIVKTLAHPTLGLGEVARKIALKAAEEAKK